MGPGDDERGAAALASGAVLLRCSARYLLDCLGPVNTAALSSPTPCPAWDLHALLAHLDDALTALTEVTETGHVGLDPATDAAPDALLPGRVRRRATRLLETLPGTPCPPARRTAFVDGWPLAYDEVAAAGAVEVALHGWDVSRSCGPARPIPVSLARPLLDVARHVVGPADRPVRFAAPLPAPAGSTPGDRLLAFLGRCP